MAIRSTEKSKRVVELMTEPRQMRHRCPIRETILVMCTQRRSHAIAHDIKNFGELLGDPRVGRDTIKKGEGLQEARMNADILASERGVNRALPTNQAIDVAIADEGTIAAYVAEITSVLAVAGVTIDPVKALSSKVQRRRFADSSEYRQARQNSIGETMDVLSAPFDWLAGPVEATEPATGSLVPERAAQVRKAVFHGFPQAAIVWVSLACFGCKPCMSRLKLQQLLVRTARFPAVVEVAKKPAIFAI